MLLVIPGYVHVAFITAGVICALVLIFSFYKKIMVPVIQTMLDRDSPPPKEGTIIELIVEPPARSKKFHIGQVDADLPTRMVGIHEDHMKIEILKERGLEEYEITLDPGGPVLYRPPHAKNLEFMKSKETFESRELIGHPAGFRLAATVKDNRALQYVEFELSTKYFIDRVGEERMKFLLELKRIYPAVDEKKRTRSGKYPFGRLKVEEVAES